MAQAVKPSVTGTGTAAAAGGRQRLPNHKMAEEPPEGPREPGAGRQSSRNPRSCYKLVSLLLIGIAAWGIGFGLISSLRVVGVAIAVGIFLFLIALVGLIGAVKHHQVLLFFYMIILLLVFIVQFSVSCACLALNKEQQSQLLEVGWNNTNSARADIERNLNCCGFRTFDPNETCLSDCFRSHQCRPCLLVIEEYSGMVLRFVGGIGLFFSFTEILGVWLTYRYRNQKDPRANPSAFL
ncbi:tetraspanin-13 [Nothoprocta perdicaria]|uniref:tetraspanin-13 n=1 Tax=Nothoprocta perdicaria TaxID=30464 RepID=UPI000E1B55A3|nr:tetraspanin-13 [Nothoprocta perdicaria]